MPGQRMRLHEVDQRAYEAMRALERYVHRGNLSEALIELVKIRASQLNRCAYCMDMHSHNARRAGIPQRKLDVLVAWREAASIFDEQERAALALTEEMTLIARGGVSEAVWHDASNAFSDQDLATLMMAICAINSWNRIAVATRQPLPLGGEAVRSER